MRGFVDGGGTILGVGAELWGEGRLAVGIISGKERRAGSRRSWCVMGGRIGWTRLSAGR